MVDDYEKLKAEHARVVTELESNYKKIEETTKVRRNYFQCTYIQATLSRLHFQFEEEVSGGTSHAVEHVWNGGGKNERTERWNVIKNTGTWLAS